MDPSTLRLRALPFLLRIAFSFAALVLLGGYVASGLYVVDHHGDRDGREGLSLDDVEGVYHGVVVESSLIDLIESGHPAEVEGAEPLHEEDRAFLLAWLRSDRVAEDWGNIDLGDGYGSPEEVVADACATCHGRAADEARRAEPPLQYWDDVAAVALPRDVRPTDTAILLASTHAHALGMGAVTVAALLLLAFTGWPSWLRGAIGLAASLGLLVDLGAWWLARETAGLAPLIVAGGTAHAGGIVLALLLVLGELWRPWSAV